MRWNRQTTRVKQACLGILLAWLWASAITGKAEAQQGSLLPNPRLFTVMPPGGKAGSTVTVTFSGTDLEEPQALVFSHPGIKAVPMVPPAPPRDPKKPPAPTPPVTKFKVTIAADVPVGHYDVRLVNHWGVSNPRVFVVGDLAETAEKEPNDDVDKAQRVDINTTINGVIANPTDVDYYVFAGKKGQRVIVSCLASSIDSRLEPDLKFYDSRQKQLAVNRHYQGTDALVDCTLANDGDYYVRVCQFTYAEGNAEHFYRLSISTAPWIDAIHPCVVEPGKATRVTVYGRNLPGGKPDPTAMDAGRVLEKVQVSVTPPSDPAALHRLAFNGYVKTNTTVVDGFEYRIRNASGVSNPFFLSYARAPLVLDSETNNQPDVAQDVSLPCEIAGRIQKKRDYHWYAFTVKKGEVYNIEILSDRLGAPTDMYFVLRNPAKQEIADFDDHTEVLSFNFKFYAVTEDPGVYTFTVPADGKYQLMVAGRYADTLFGMRHYYGVRITPAHPDFHLVIMPAADSRPDGCLLLQGGNQQYTVFAWRHDGWNGDITLTAENLPKGVRCMPQTLGTGLRQTTLVLQAAADAPVWTGQIKVTGRAQIQGKTEVREARPVSITWPFQPGAGIPAVTRLDRGLWLAVRPKAPFQLTATIDKPFVVQGDKATIVLKLARLWPDFKNQLQLQQAPQEIVPNVSINNNQPFTIAQGKDTGSLPVVVNPAAPPGTYNIVFRCSAQIPFNKDPKAKQKPAINVVQPATPVVLTVLPKQVASVSVSNSNPTVKIGGQTEILVRAARMYDFAGEFKVQLLLPPNTSGITADEVTIPAGKDEAKLILKTPANTAPGVRSNLTVRVTAFVHDKIPAIQEAKINVNVVK